MSGWIKAGMLALMALGTLVSCAQNQADAQMGAQAIEARRALMRDNSRNAKVVGAFLKKGEGTAADVAKSARKIASNTALFVNLFPKGTGENDGAGKTRAKAQIWTDQAGFNSAAAKLSELAWNVAMAAGSGDKGAIGKAMGAMGKAGCGGCHRVYRGKKK